MNDEAQREYREVQSYFRLPSLSLVEKDVYVVRAIQAVTTLDASPFRLVFGGGTALARAHKLVRRMSEDVDFKVIQPADTVFSKSQRRLQLGALRQKVTAALQAAGFAFDPTDETVQRSKDKNEYLIWQLPYDSAAGAGEELRSTVQLELTYAPLRLPPDMRPVSSFVAEAFGRPAEVGEIPCVSLAQTAAEKLVSLTRRTAMERAGISRAVDPTLVRHIYDLHILREYVDGAAVAALALEIAAADAIQFRNQDPAYAADIAGVTHAVLAAFQADPVYRLRYAAFLTAMVYGERPGFDDAMATVIGLAKTAWFHGD